VMRSSADYFRSKCSKKGWRPAKGSKQEALLLQARWNQQEEQEEQEQTDALDPAGTLITPHVNALRFQPSFDPYNWQSLEPYYYDYCAAFYAGQIWQHALTPSLGIANHSCHLLPSTYATLPPSRGPTWDSGPECSGPYQANITAEPLQIPRELVHVGQVPIGVGETIQVACAECGCECQSTTSDYSWFSWCDRCWCDG